MNGAAAATTDTLSLLAFGEGSSKLIVPRRFTAGTNTLDARGMMAIPTALTLVGKTAAWKYDQAGRASDGFALETTLVSPTPDVRRVAWSVQGGATTTKVQAPSSFPDGVPDVISDHALHADQTVLTVYDVLGQPRRFDLDPAKQRWGAAPEGVAFAVVWALQSW